MNLGVYKVIRSIDDERIGRIIDVKERGFFGKALGLGDKFSMPREIGIHEYFNEFVCRHRNVEINSVKDLYEFASEDEIHMSVLTWVTRPIEGKEERLKALMGSYKYQNAKRFKRILEREFGEYLGIETVEEM